MKYYRIINCHMVEFIGCICVQYEHDHLNPPIMYDFSNFSRSGIYLHPVIGPNDRYFEKFNFWKSFVIVRLSLEDVMELNQDDASIYEVMLT